MTEGMTERDGNTNDSLTYRDADTGLLNNLFDTCRPT